MACSKLIIIDLGCCSTRSDNLYFANNEQASLVVFTAAFCFVHAKYNLIKLRREPRIFWDVTVLVCDSIFRKERFYPSGVERFPYR